MEMYSSLYHGSEHQPKCIAFPGDLAESVPRGNFRLSIPKLTLSYIAISCCPGQLVSLKRLLYESENLICFAIFLWGDLIFKSIMYDI